MFAATADEFGRRNKAEACLTRCTINFIEHYLGSSKLVSLTKETNRFQFAIDPTNMFSSLCAPSPEIAAMIEAHKQSRGKDAMRGGTTKVPPSASRPVPKLSVLSVDSTAFSTTGSRTRNDAWKKTTNGLSTTPGCDRPPSEITVIVSGDSASAESPPMRGSFKRSSHVQRPDSTNTSESFDAGLKDLHSSRVPSNNTMEELIRKYHDLETKHFF
jgi:hypothetical protein